MNIKTLLTDELFVATTQAELGQYHSREEVIAGRAIAKTKRVIWGWLGRRIYSPMGILDEYVSLKVKDWEEFKKWGNE